MDFYAVGPECVGLYVHNVRNIDRDKAGALIKQALSGSGLEVWDSMEADIFCGDGGVLILARPCRIQKAVIADYALPFLGGI